MKLRLLTVLLLSLPAFANQAVQGWCEAGNQTVSTTISGNPYTSSTLVQRSYPSCTITVYNTGTLTKTTIYSDNLGTGLSNPFTATSTGFWQFYAANTIVDVALSGGGIGVPFTLPAITLFDYTTVNSDLVTLDGNQTITGTKQFNPGFTIGSGAPYSINGSGVASLASLSVVNGITTGSGSYGLNASGVLTAASAGFSGGITVDNGTYGLTAGGALTINSCSGCPSSSPAGSTNQIQYYSSGLFGASTNFTYNPSSSALQIVYTGSGSGVISPLYNANISGLSNGTKTFKNSDGSWTADNQGNLAAQTLALAGNLTFPGCSYPCGVQAHAFSSDATGSQDAFVVNSGTGTWTGDGHFATQYVNVAYGLLVGCAVSGGSGCQYGITAAGEAVVSSCSGCGTVSVPGANTDIIYNNSSAFGASSNFTYNVSTSTLQVVRTGSSSGVTSPVFNGNIASNTGNTFQNSDGSWAANYLGKITSQVLVLAGGIQTSTSTTDNGAGSQTSEMGGVGGGGDFESNWTVGANAANNFAFCSNTADTNGYCTSSTPGNLYLRGIYGGDASCSGIKDVWVAIRTDSGNYAVEMCINGSLHKITFT